jgi:hypothetical protein
MIEKNRLLDIADETLNNSYIFHDLSRELKRAKKNPLEGQAELLSKELFRAATKISTFLEKLEDEGLLGG